MYFYHFFNLCLLGKDFVCNKMTLLFYDGASDFLLGLLFYDDASDLLGEIAVLRRCQANCFIFGRETQISPLVPRAEHGSTDW